MHAGKCTSVHIPGPETAVLARIADTAIARPRRSALIAVAVFVIVGVLGGPAPGKLDVQRAFDDPGSESTHARRQIERVTGHSASADVIALVKAPPSSPRVAQVAKTLRADRGVASVVAPPASGRSPLVSADRSESLVAASLRRGVAPRPAAERIHNALAGQRDVTLGGTAVAQDQVNKQATSDLALSEALAFPLLALLSILIFRGIAAALPLAVGGISVLTTFAVLRAVNVVLPLSPFALNLVIGMGLGLAVDYSLFLVSRFREELGGGADVPQAVRTTVATAGRTVLFSAGTVAAALVCLTVFPQRFLVSMGVGGVATALVAATVSLLLLPALFVLFGARLGKVRPGPERSGRWYGLATRVMRRPGAVALITGALLLAVAAPATGLHWTSVSAKVLPTDKSARIVSDTIERDFPGADSTPIVVAVSAPASAQRDVNAYAARLSRVEGVRNVSPPRNLGQGTWQIDVHARGDAAGSAAQDAVAGVRAEAFGHPVLIGGQPADLKDQRAGVARMLPLAAVTLVVLTLSMLWLMTGSVVLPVKTLLMNLLTTAATTGLVVLIFQRGHLAGLVGSSAQGGIEQTDYMVLAAIVFGLSTDYGVFLLTRIKEARDRGLPDRDAIAVGMQRTGAIVTAAALLLAVALGALATAHVAFLKELGIGTALAVLIDAFIVRALLVPSLMALLGGLNWWSPRPLRRAHRRIGFVESGPAIT
jgi:uncharacterized membrane protein YdfJ with MMPL/SSD domain